MELSLSHHSCEIFKLSFKLSLPLFPTLPFLGKSRARQTVALLFQEKTTSFF
jgi:hypothetical protein